MAQLAQTQTANATAEESAIAPVIDITNKQTQTAPKGDNSTLQLVKPIADEKIAFIRERLGNQTGRAGRIYAKFTDEQKTAMCVMAGLKATEVHKSFDQLATEQKRALHQAMLEMDKIVKAFRDANILTAKDFCK